MPPKATRKTLAEFLAAETSADTKPNDAPVVGEIWWAVCSIREAVLDVVREFSLAPPSFSMITDRQLLLYNGEEKRARPCIVMRVLPNKERTVIVVPMTTFGGSPIQTLDGHTKDLSISIDNTPRWPNKDSHVIRTTPPWPLTFVTPCYAISHACTLSSSDMIQKYAWPIAPRPEDAGGTSSTNQRTAQKANKPVSLFTLMATRRLQLQKEIATREKRIKQKPIEKALAANAAWDERRRAIGWRR